MSKRNFLLPATIVLAAALLIGATRTGSAAETQVFSTVLQPTAAGQTQSQTVTAPPVPAGSIQPPAGMVGFGWG